MPQTRIHIAPLWSRVGFLVRRLHQISVAIFHLEMDGLDLTPVQFGAITIIVQQPGIDQSGLGAELGVDRANGAEVVARLVKAGLIGRKVSARDRRIRELYITEKGEALAVTANARLKAVQDRLLAPLDPEEQAHFIRLLTKVVEQNNAYGRALLRFNGLPGDGQASSSKPPASPPASP